MDPSKRSGIGFLFAPTGAALVLCALALMSAVLNASVVPISSSANLGAATGSLTFGDGTLRVTQDVTTSLLATNTDSAGNTALFNVGLGKILQDARALGGNGDLMRFNSGTSILPGSGSNGTGSTNISGILSLPGTVTLGTGNFAFTGGILELGNSNFTRAFGSGVRQVNINNASSGTGFAAFGADRVVDLTGRGATVTWNAENVTLSSGSITGTGTGISMASTYAIQSDAGSPILDGSGSTITKTPVEPDALTAIKTWTGGSNTNDNWSRNNNWGGTAAVPGDSLFFGGNTRLTPNNDLTADASFVGITFNSGAGAFTLIGNRITLGGNRRRRAHLKRHRFASGFWDGHRGRTDFREFCCRGSHSDD